jgi:glycosyltransferase involved in cell wall biosynthesis
LAQGLDQLLDLAKMIPADAPGRLVLIGDGPVRAHLARRISLEAIDRVTLADAVPRERVPEILAAADGALISLGRSIPGAVPSKIYEAMATARPILLVAEGEPARRVVSAGAGLAVRPGDISGLLAAFLELAMDPRLRQCLGEAGRKAAETLYNRENVANRLDELLREVLE